MATKSLISSGKIPGKEFLLKTLIQPFLGAETLRFCEISEGNVEAGVRTEVALCELVLEPLRAGGLERKATPGFLTASERAVNVPRMDLSLQKAVSAFCLSHLPLTAFSPSPPTATPQ